MQQEKYFKWSLLLLFLSYLFLHDYRLLLLSVLDKKYAKIFHEELLLWRRKKTKIIHENDAIQSENSPMLFIQKIILSQEWYDVCNYYHYYSISWKYTRISICNISVVLCFSILWRVKRNSRTVFVLNTYYSEKLNSWKCNKYYIPIIGFCIDWAI